MKKKLIVGVLASVLLITGCTSKKNETNKPEGETPVVQDDTTTELKVNKELTENLQSEDGITDGQVFEKEGKAIGSITVDKAVSDDDAKEIAKRYAKEIKNAYKDLPVNVEIIRDDKTVVNESIDAKDNTQEKPQENGKEDTQVDQDPQSVVSAEGRVVADPILMTFIARIPADGVPNATPDDVLLLTVEGETYELAYNSERKVYQNGIIQAENEESVENSLFAIQKKQFIRS